MKTRISIIFRSLQQLVARIVERITRVGQEFTPDHLEMCEALGYPYRPIPAPLPRPALKPVLDRFLQARADREAAEFAERERQASEEYQRELALASRVDEAHRRAAAAVASKM